MFVLDTSMAWEFCSSMAVLFVGKWNGTESDGHKEKREEHRYTLTRE